MYFDVGSCTAQVPVTPLVEPPTGHAYDVSHLNTKLQVSDDVASNSGLPWKRGKNSNSFITESNPAALEDAFACVQRRLTGKKLVESERWLRIHYNEHIFVACGTIVMK